MIRKIWESLKARWNRPVLLARQLEAIEQAALNQARHEREQEERYPQRRWIDGHLTRSGVGGWQTFSDGDDTRRQFDGAARRKGW